MKNFRVYIYCGNVKIQKEDYLKKINPKQNNENISTNVIMTKEFETYAEAVSYVDKYNYNTSIKFIEKQAVTKEANEFYDDNYILESTNEGDFVFEITPYGESFGITEEMIKSTFIMI